MRPPRLPRSIARLGGWLRPNQRQRWTSAGLGYLAVWVGLIATGLYQQINLLLLTAGLAAGPIVASFAISLAMLRKVRLSRRLPDHLFAGKPLVVDYQMENIRRATAALALQVVDELTPADPLIPAAGRAVPRVLFARVPPKSRLRIRWQGPGLGRGRYNLGSIELTTRAPFGLLERTEIVPLPDSLIVYPAIGRLTRRWQPLQRESTETRRGRRHDRTAQQQEYHGLREYRAGDSMRWIHWRTTARLGQPMVKEFEQQNDQELAILLDPWLPRTRVTAEQRHAVEEAIRFVATLCYETCRHPGRRILLGWAGPTPGIRRGPASVKLLHEMLESLAVMRGTAEGQLSAVLDAMPPAMLREASIVIVSTRPVNLAEEAERSERLASANVRGLAGRATVLDASAGDLSGLIEFDGPTGSPDRPEPVGPEGEVRPAEAGAGSGEGMGGAR